MNLSFATGFAVHTHTVGIVAILLDVNYHRLFSDLIKYFIISVVYSTNFLCILDTNDVVLVFLNNPAKTPPVSTVLKWYPSSVMCRLYYGRSINILSEYNMDLTISNWSYNHSLLCFTELFILLRQRPEYMLR